MPTAEALLHLRTDPVMARLIEAVGPCTLDPQPTQEPFASLARAITHQQLNGTAATRIFERFKALFAAPFPTPSQVLGSHDDQLRAVGFSYSKVAALKDLAAKTLAGIVPPREQLEGLADSEIIERLTAVRGIGRWTVEMLLIFQLGRPDVLPVDDFGVRNGFRLAYRLAGMPLPRALAQFGERWRPHRTIAAWYLWRAVDLSRTDQLPRCARPPRVAIKPQVAIKSRVAGKVSASKPRRAKAPSPGNRKSALAHKWKRASALRKKAAPALRRKAASRRARR